jgi:hypothetical protein
MVHTHIDTTAIEFGKHLLDALGARGGPFGPADPGEVVIPLVKRTLLVGRQKLPRLEFSADILRHWLH